MNYSDDEIGNLQKSLNHLADIILEKMNSHILEQNKLEVTIETIDDGIAVINPEKEIIICNRAFNRFIGHEGNSKNNIYYEVIRNSYLNEKIAKNLSEGTASSFKRKVSEKRYCEIFLNPIKDANSNQGMLIVLHDLSES
jgi:PAS domain S-box-containing protein